MHNILEKMKNLNLRITKPRREIIRVLWENRGKNLDAGEIYVTLVKRGIDIDQATVYRNLELLFNMKIIHKSNFTHQHAHFGLMDEFEIHFICRGCGEIFEKSLKQDDIITNIENINKGFEEDSVSIEVYGLCKKCQKKQNKKK
ncbi:MAG TPA: Fur family transcriptional regulator [Caldisericia bacterium]|nr:Fur family transcriptional regulator [Caldisericia bacterium]HPF49481.1 Fur family transcriptional regulator [Caldisericia bacterium]HPI84225.1 Fur family transcriptional regulator [Caldisericia bacterium]HPQ93480.1 Fur family transcriptional regulator [Caldisericia bacterium]HRV75514.1 Fur family transcriptional regulator [Caldisericia bacterium]